MENKKFKVITDFPEAMTELYDPEGNLIAKTDNFLAIQLMRLDILMQGLEGYYVIDEFGQKCEINSKSNFDIAATRIYIEILSRILELRTGVKPSEIKPIEF